MRSLLLKTVALLAATATATTPPTYSGFKLVWHSGFDGAKGTLPNEGTWNIISGNLGVNDELETYRASPNEVQQTGESTLVIIPRKDSTAPNGWSSGRIESSYTFTPEAQAMTRVEARIRFGTNPIADKQGIWPAFWMLGDSGRHGTAWPACGELDILETIDGQLTGYGTMHCDVDPGGICDEPNGLGSSISIPNQGWHVWRLEFDRTNTNWEDQTITWSMDGERVQQIAGSQIGDLTVWESVCHKPLYFILNVAIGGSWVSLLALILRLWARRTDLLI